MDMTGTRGTDGQTEMNNQPVYITAMNVYAYQSNLIKGYTVQLCYEIISRWIAL